MLSEEKSIRSFLNDSEKRHTFAKTRERKNSCKKKKSQKGMRKKELYERTIAYFREAMPVAETELKYANSFELLVAVVLSAQCTDKRVNLTTPALFSAYPTPLAMSKASEEEIFEYIHSISYPHNKARHLLALSKMLVEDFHGKVPCEGEQLERLPGVGRKTANVIQAVYFGKAKMAVDTHVFRVSHRIGLVPKSCTTPLSVERELCKHIPENDIPLAHHWLILHGRYVCTARRPKCEICGLKDFCTEKICPK